jgi:solute carrier family 30 (zinc transporter), member 5/7
VLSGFVNGILLVLIAFFVFVESIERMLEPPEVKTERLLLVSVLGFVVNILQAKQTAFKWLFFSV